MKFQDIHIGRLIEQTIADRHLTKTEFARKIGIAQPHVQRVLEKPSFDTDKLKQISIILDYNFFDCLQPINNNTHNNETIDYIRGKRDGYDEAIKLLTNSKKPKQTA